ncbi:MAG: sigma-70 family RNA polymerase sigma factor [Bacteroidota bacterium]
MNDLEILQFIREGGIPQERVFTYLYQTYHDWIRLAKMRHQLSEEEATDAYSDAILALQKQVKAGEFQGKSKLSTYLNSIFHRKCIDQIRRKQKKSTIPLSEMKEDMGDVVHNIEQQMIISELFAYVIRQIDHLGTVCRQVLLDKYYWGYEDMAEIALRAGIKNANTAGSIRYRGMQQLMRRLKNHPNPEFELNF